MKTILCSMIDDNFVVAFKGFIKSLLKYNPNFNYTIRLIDAGINEYNKQVCKKYYKNIEFVKPKKENYKGLILDITPVELKSTYYKLDIFSYDDIDRLIFIDLDTLILGNISYLFNLTAPISGCLGYNVKGDRLRKDINSGVIVLNKPLISEKIYTEILQLVHKKQGFSMPDQKAIKFYFKDNINNINKIYNCEKRLWKGTNYKIAFNSTKNLIYYSDSTSEAVKILHYVAGKPWQDKKDEFDKGYEDLEKLWWEYYNG